MLAKNKVVAIYSGGLDSTVLLHHLLSGKARQIGLEVMALSVDYGQRHAVELEHAKVIAHDLGIEHEIADLSSITHLLGAGGSSQVSSTPVPHGHYADESMKTTVVPNRNMIMLSVAAGWAIAKGAHSVAYGAHAGDHAIYPDCRQEFAGAMEVALKLCDWSPIALWRPFIDFTKTEIVRLGAELDVDFSKTWSCYEGGEIHCGRCGTCVERIEAFHDAGVEDPTQYDFY